MTDNEIIKALECCINYNDCDKCDFEPKDNKKKTIGCCLEIMKNALDLITRKQAEIERLQNILLAFMSALGKVENVEDIESIPQIPIMWELNKQFRAEIKSEAFKEFAKKLKELDGYDNHNFDDCVSILVSEEYKKGRYEKTHEIWSTIDNLVKEMVGD